MSTDVTDIFAELDIQDPPDYYGGFKDGRVLEFGDTELVASDWRTGAISGGSTYRYTLSDYDRTFRRQLASFTDRYWIGNETQWLVSPPARNRKDSAYCAFNGVVMDAQPRSPLAVQVTLSDIVSARMFNEKSGDLAVPWRKIGDGFLDQLLEVSDTLDREIREASIYGRHIRTPNDPASPEGFRVVPTYLGKEDVAGDSYYVWLVCGHACADILDLSTYVIEDDKTVTVTSVIANEGTDWLVPHFGGWNAIFTVPYRDRRSSTYGNDRRYTLIYGKVGNTDPDACVAGDKILTVALEGIEPAGDGTQAVITDRLLQYKDFVLNHVANQGLNSYQTGARLTSPSWTLIDGVTVPIVDEQSWDDCSAIGVERLPLVPGSPALQAGYVGIAYIIDGTLPSVIADWNRSCSTQFAVNRYGQMFVFMLHPTDDIKTAAPLLTDQEDILIDSFEPRIETDGQANAIPFQTDFDHGTGGYATVGLAEAGSSIVNYDRRILGETRTYPMAPGSTMAYHLARLEVIRSQDAPRFVSVDTPVGPDELDNSFGYLRCGDYFRYRHFASISDTAGSIRLAQIQRCGVRVGQRRCWAEALDVEDLIDYDAPSLSEGSPGSFNDTCDDAKDMGDLSEVYETTQDTTDHATDLSVGGSPSFAGDEGPGIAYHAAWFKMTGNIYDGVATFSTIDSDYDTQLVVYSGSCGALVPQGYNDNFGVLQTAVLDVSIVGGTDYFILACGYGPDDGGSLHFRAVFTPNP